MDETGDSPTPRLDFTSDGHPDPRYLKSAKPLARSLSHSWRVSHFYESWRHRMCHVFESQRFHVLVICLTLLDLVFVVSELIIEVVAQQNSCHLISEAGEPHAEIQFSPAVHAALDALFWASLSILAFFSLEILLKLLVYGPLYFLRHLFELLDAVIVIVSITLDLVFRGKEESVTIEVIIVLRLWRLVRVMDGVAGEVQETAEVQRRKFEKRISVYEDRVKELEKEVKDLKAGRRVEPGPGSSNGLPDTETGAPE